MSPTAAGVDLTTLPHKAQAGVVNGSDPQKFYPFCSAGDFSVPERAYDSSGAAKRDHDLLTHVESKSA